MEHENNINKEKYFSNIHLKNNNYIEAENLNNELGQVFSFYSLN